MKLSGPLLVASAMAAAALAAALGAGAHPAGEPAPPPATPDTPVVVELFTSEGCSSCPPADRYLSELAKAGSSNGVPIVALSEHVDYWNRDGWKDPFSSSSFTDRQMQYSDRLGSQVYTPQLVVDGQWETIGSDRGQAASEITRAAAEKKARVSAELTQGPGMLGVKVSVAPGALDRLPDAEVYVALTEGGLSSDVTAGENAGQHLSHEAVTRLLEKAGRIKAGAADARFETTLALDPSWAAKRSSVLVFVQAKKNRAIVGAWSTPLAGLPVRSSQ